MPRRAEKTTKKQRATGKLYPLNMRTTFELRRRLEKAAAESGHSLSREVEDRLTQSFAESPVVLARINDGLQRELVLLRVVLATLADRLGITVSELEANAKEAEAKEKKNLEGIRTALKRLGPKGFQDLVDQVEKSK